MRAMANDRIAHDAFYRFVRVDDVDATARALRELTQGLTGSVWVAPDGINGSVAGPASALDTFRTRLTSDPRLGGRLAGLSFRRSAAVTPPFQRMRVHCRSEIVPLGVDDVDAVGHRRAVASPAQWRELLDDPGVVVIDNRNRFEVRLGRFRNAVDPGVDHFRELPAYLDAQLPRWQAEGKRVAMYCTGGIRCEKTSAWLAQRGVTVLELDGGILNYFEQMPDAARDWIGECFVFDNRVALDSRLSETETTAAQVYGGDARDAWRLERARRLEAHDEPESTDSATAVRANRPSKTLRRGVPSSPLPTRDGVGPSVVALPPGAWRTVGEFLSDRFPDVAPTEWKRRMERGEVVDQHGCAVSLMDAYRVSSRLHYYRHIDDEPPSAEPEVLVFQDDRLVVADKPPFMPVTPGGQHLHETLLVRLKRRTGIDTLAPVHRLDRETSGLVVFTVQPSTRGVYQALFANRQVSKIYEAWAPWRADLTFPMQRRSRIVQDEHFLRMREEAGEPNSDTLIEVLAVHGDWARYRLQPTTGRTHQLRVHCGALGMPIAGDRMYPTLLPARTDDPTQPLQLLARSLTFVDPITGEPRQFESTRSLSPTPPTSAKPATRSTTPRG
jgi:tRNA pseudouridine32 synthase/23S rRNA pseudouridine746 synthase